MKAFRMWFACSLALAISMAFGWSYGFFAIMIPLLVLNTSDKFDLSLMLLTVFSVIWTSLQATFILEFLQFHPLLMTVSVGIMMLFKCRAMMHRHTYLFGYSGLLVGSIIFNFASYNTMDIEEFNVNMWVITLCNVFICAIAYWLFPEPEPNARSTMQSTPAKKDVDYLSQIAMGWIVVMAAFLVFQVGDLNDSLSAQASIFIVLTPMTLAGAFAMAKIRVTGTALGCLAGMAVQLILGNWYGNSVLFWLTLTIAMGPLCYLTAKGAVRSTIGFSAMAALAVPLTTSLVPEKRDAFFSILYRFSSIFVAVVLTTMVIWVVHHYVRIQMLQKMKLQKRLQARKI